MKKDVKENVKFLLENYPETRTCDLKLIARYWNKFDECYASVTISQIYNGHVTKPESIRRAKQKLKKTLEL